MKSKIIITIDSQYGSGGHEIGKMLSEKLDINFYDKEILMEAAKKSNLCSNVVETFDEKPTNGFLYISAMDSYAGSFPVSRNSMPITEQVYLHEFHAIEQLASKGSSIFVGRCADYVLQKNRNCMNVFIYAPLEYRVKRIEQNKRIGSEEAEKIIRKADKERAAYYNYYTHKKWGHVSSYHLCVDSSLCKIEGTVDGIEKIVKNFISVKECEKDG